MTEDLKSYRGNCHCGAFVFEAKHAVITKANDCNCSYCYKQAFVHARLTGESDVKFEKGKLADLAAYQFGTKGVTHLFCGSCGTSLFVKGQMALPSGEKFDLFTVNARSFQHGQLPNFWDMETSTFDGASFGEPYKVPEFTGPKPEVEVEGGKFYTGSCHCGAVRVGLNSKPLDKTYQGFLTDCNCSFDNRAGCAWCYPSANEVSIQGEDNVTFHRFNLGVWGKGFCKTCGVYLYGKHYPLPEEVVAKMSEEAKKWTVGGAHLRPLNMRILNGLDLKELNLGHTEGYTNIPGGYVEP
ncbi:glutathione-dependent formaldehyde-activating enzyme [Microdochium bolleyi]|uniref:Glutathione-dependent formaldehyde-activating enzyme n=1 Tax=Microdochium bolleyi TaxID=196109 RepID=A0A136J4X0_9PEZI|nr:glutathione-dependent formaldehyde-activating enzyme [Microdochium bolleyi]